MINVFEHLVFVHLTLKYMKYSKFGCGVNVHFTYVYILYMWMLHTKIPFACARNMYLMYVRLIFKHQQNTSRKYAFEMFVVGAY
jgi:hypothetical protein